MTSQRSLCRERANWTPEGQRGATVAEENSPVGQETWSTSRPLKVRGHLPRGSWCEREMEK